MERHRIAGHDKKVRLVLHRLTRPAVRQIAIPELSRLTTFNIKT